MHCEQFVNDLVFVYSLTARFSRSYLTYRCIVSGLLTTLFLFIRWQRVSAGHTSHIQMHCERFVNDLVFAYLLTARFSRSYLTYRCIVSGLLTTLFLFICWQRVSAGHTSHTAALGAGTHRRGKYHHHSLTMSNLKSTRWRYLSILLPIDLCSQFFPRTALKLKRHRQ